MSEVLDGLSFVFWSAAYGLIILFSLRDPRQYVPRMPLSVGAVCLAWELAAVVQGEGVVWGHVLWLVLDTVILFLNFRILWHTKRKQVLYYGLYTAFWLGAIWGIFLIPYFDGMLLSSFLLDAAIAFEYVRKAGSIPREGKLLIGACRFLGDLPAWIGNWSDPAVAVLGAVSLGLTVFYMLYCLEERHTKKKGK